MSRFIRPTRKLLNSISCVSPLQTPKWLGNNSFSTYEETLLNIPPTKVSVLNNGLRIATEDSGSLTATVGLYIFTGSRFETDENNGASHFLERLIFKGTKKRSQTDFELEVENIGAQFKAYTSVEQTAFYAKCLSQNLPKVVEILSDCIQNTKLGELEIEREREALIQEIQNVDLETTVFDHLHSVAFQGTPLSKSVLGPLHNIKSMTKQDLIDYINLHYKAPRIVLAGAGGVDHDTLVLLAEEHLKDVPWTYDAQVPEYDFCRFTGSEVRVRDDDIPLAHIAIAFEGVGLSDPDYIPLMVAKTLVGSWDRTHGGGIHNSSRLAQAATKYNICHLFKSFNLSYKDTGLWGIYFVCERLTIDDFVHFFRSEWMRLCTDATEFEVERAKNILRTQLLLQLDGTTGICEDIGTQILSRGKRISFNDLDAQIQAVDAEYVKEVIYKHVYDRCPAVCGVGPVEQLPDYNNMRSGFYRLRL